MSAAQRLSTRRRVLRGILAGTAVSVGLPFLDCFLTGDGTALAATGQALPVCFGTWFWGCGFSPERWVPKSPGPLGELPPELVSLAAFKSKLNVYTGMKVHLDGRPSSP